MSDKNSAGRLIFVVLVLCVTAFSCGASEAADDSERGATSIREVYDDVVSIAKDLPRDVVEIVKEGNEVVSREIDDHFDRKDQELADKTGQTIHHPDRGVTIKPQPKEPVVREVPERDDL